MVLAAGGIVACIGLDAGVACRAALSWRRFFGEWGSTLPAFCVDGKFGGGYPAQERRQKAAKVRAAEALRILAMGHYSQKFKKRSFLLDKSSRMGFTIINCALLP